VGIGEGPGVTVGGVGEEREGMGRGELGGRLRQPTIVDGSQIDIGKGGLWEKHWHQGCRGAGEAEGQRGRGEANGAAARENSKDGECNGAGRPIGRCGLPIGHWQQIFAMVGVHRISTTTARFFEKANQRGHQKKGNHQEDNNQPHRLTLNIEGKGHGG